MCEHFQLGKNPCKRGNKRDESKHCPDYTLPVYRGDFLKLGKKNKQKRKLCPICPELKNCPHADNRTKCWEYDEAIGQEVSL